MTSLKRSCFHQFTCSTKYLLAISCALAEGHKWRAGYQDPSSQLLDECGKHQGKEGSAELPNGYARIQPGAQSGRRP